MGHGLSLVRARGMQCSYMQDAGTEEALHQFPLIGSETELQGKATEMKGFTHFDVMLPLISVFVLPIYQLVPSF